ncbi:hypothetical protein [Rheinheimera hassiensis]|uniref:hypothetical protein n=1 Tax=Rheinheimera hassiensis TaxID=1193627 RepID=UPI001F0687EF|nr:hypothetical protein [Rheinheimera hassiensis]
MEDPENLVNEFSYYMDESVPVYGIESIMMNDSATVKNIGYGTSVWISESGRILEVESLYPSRVFKESNALLIEKSEAPIFTFPVDRVNDCSVDILNCESIFLIKWGEGKLYHYESNGVIIINDNVVMGVGVFVVVPSKCPNK